MYKIMSVTNESDAGTLRMNLWNCMFLYVCIFLFSSQCASLKSDNFVCRLTDTCQCMFENQEGVDLSALSENRYGLNTTKNNLTFYFHPCTEISVGNASDSNACSAVSVCLFNHTDHVYTSLGSSHNLTVVSHGIKNPIIFKYKHNNSTTNILLNCVTAEDSLEVLPSEEAGVYELKLNSKTACRQKVFVRSDPAPEPAPSLSTGSVLVIMFVVFVSLYFVGGALTLKLLRGAEGHEMIPNYDFWVSLPGLVQEGFMFVVNGCRPIQAYDRI